MSSNDPSEPGQTVAPTGPTAAYLGGVNAESRSRLLGLGVLELVEDAADAALVVLSTRLRRSDISSEMAAAKARALPVVVLTHTGGEASAVEMMRGGGAAIIAEGNEAALLSHLMGGAIDSGMLETYERRMGSGSNQSAPGEASDGATGLPALAAFEERLEQLHQNGELPRLAYMKILNLDTNLRMSPEGLALLRRRLALQYLALARTLGADLYALNDNQFAIVAVGLPAERTEHLARQMSRVTESFAPSGTQPLALAVGHAGPEVATEMGTLRELALRASVVAAEARVSRVVSAASLSLGLAATTELEAALRIIEVIERGDIYEPGHGARMASLAHDVARQLGFEPSERAQVRLAAHLADIGKIGLPSAALVDPALAEPAQAEIYQSHARRGADYIRTSAGQIVSEAIAHHHERWDGSGYPDGLAGSDIPIIARIIAVADTFDHLTNAANPTQRLSRQHALARLREEAGTALDPAVVDVAIAMLEARTDLSPVG